MSKDLMPTDYFKNLKSKILNEVLSLEDELGSNAPILYNLKGKNSYLTPNNYFEDNLLKIKSFKARPTRVLYFKVASIAAMLLVLVTAFWHVTNSTLPETSLAENEILDYYIGNDEDIDSDILLEISENYEPDFDIELANVSDEELDIYIESILDDLNINDFATIDY
ncbi:MAG: hypothetical protein HKO66_01785 [Saprospiraceae bacterium]|nr:hypothetical protein [Bacteroidia bacterium]NNL90941.1 hypothetical protein [Saprospiraceae bacterium]